MATANPLSEDLTRCGICKEIITNPKALPCLHTFCLECLKEWIKSSLDSLTCPILACKKTVSLPPDGVDGLPENVFVSSLIEISPARSRKIPCLCCEAVDNEVLAKCFDCNGFLCQEGVDMHSKPLLKTHHLVKLEDIKSGKFDIKTLAIKMKPTCNKHEGQPLWFFCKTCEVLICRDCTVVTHQKPDHLHVELESIASEQRKKLQNFVEENEKVQLEVEKGIEQTTEASTVLDSHVKSMIDEIDRTMVKIKIRVDYVCRAEKKRLLAEQAKFETETRNKISTAADALIAQREGLHTALNMAKQVLHTGSDYDVASMYKQITTVLEKYGKLESEYYSEDMQSLPRFQTHPLINDFTRIGFLVRDYSSQSWVLEGNFGGEAVQQGPGELYAVRGITIAPNGYVVLASSGNGYPVKVYSISGNFKFSLAQQSAVAWDVAVSPAGQFYVTHLGIKGVTVYGSDGQYQFEFTTRSTTDVSSDDEDAWLRGLAVNDSSGQIVVGDVRKKYISIHNLNGDHLKSISVAVEPRYIATTHEGNIIVSSNTMGEGVQVLAPGGERLNTINAPKGVSMWYPVGVCCGLFDNIYVFNRGNPVGIYRFTSSGQYIECVNEDTVYECMYGGLTISQNGEKLLVACGSTIVKLFRKE